jgi:NAD(P)H-dependent FMN reductase
MNVLVVSTSLDPASKSRRLAKFCLEELCDLCGPLLKSLLMGRVPPLEAASTLISASTKELVDRAT